MLYNYFTIAFRNLGRQKVFSFINIFGLSVSVAVCLLIVLFVQDELSYDYFHSQADRIVLFQQSEGYSGSGGGFAQLFNNEMSQAEEVTRLVKVKPLISLENQTYSGFLFCCALSLLIAFLTVSFQSVKAVLTNPVKSLRNE